MIIAPEVLMKVGSVSCLTGSSAANYSLQGVAQESKAHLVECSYFVERPKGCLRLQGLPMPEQLLMRLLYIGLKTEGGVGSQEIS